MPIYTAFHAMQSCLVAGAYAPGTLVVIFVHDAQRPLERSAVRRFRDDFFPASDLEESGPPHKLLAKVTVRVAESNTSNVC